MPAVGTRFLQLSEHPAGARGASLLLLAAASLRSLVGPPLLGSGGGAGAGAVPTASTMSASLSLDHSVFLYEQGTARSEGAGLRGAGTVLPPPVYHRHGAWPRSSVVSLGSGYLAPFSPQLWFPVTNSGATGSVPLRSPW